MSAVKVLAQVNDFRFIESMGNLIIGCRCRIGILKRGEIIIFLTTGCNVELQWQTLSMRSGSSTDLATLKMTSRCDRC